MARQRVRIHEHTSENDLRYRGPLGPQSFQVLGWVCIILALVAALISLGAKFDASLKEALGGLGNALTLISKCSLPFLLIANFSFIMNSTNGYKPQLLKNGGAAVGIVLAAYLFGGRYFIGTLEQLVVQKEEVLPLVESIFQMIRPSGYIAFNLFIDLFLCTLIMYFLNARPKRFFTDKKIIILRLLVILPIAYEGVCLWLKIESASGRMLLPLWAMPLLTVKPPMMVFLFIFMAFLIRIREWRFCRHGRTYEEYQEFMQSNRNSFQLSLRLAICMAVFAIIDLVLYVVLMYGLAGSRGMIDAATGDIAEQSLNTLDVIATDIGIGQSWPMLLVAPLMLLYSYNRVPKRKVVGMLLPVVAIAIMILITCEAVRFGVGALMEGKQLDLNELQETLKMLMAE